MLRDAKHVLFYMTVIIYSTLCIGYAYAQTDSYPVPDTISSQVEPVLQPYPVPNSVAPTGESPQTVDSIPLDTVNHSLSTVGWSSIAFNEFTECHTIDNLGGNQYFWGETGFSHFDYGTFLGYWPLRGGANGMLIQQSAPSGDPGFPPVLYVPNVDTTLTCKWGAARLRWGDEQLPDKVRASYDLWLDLASNDYLEVTIQAHLGGFAGSVQLFQKTYSSADQPDDHILAEITPDISYGLNDGVEIWHNLEISFRFVSADDDTQSRVGAMVADLDMEVFRESADYTCDQITSDLAGINRAGMNLGYRVPGEEAFLIRGEDPRLLFDLQNLGVSWTRFVFYPEYPAMENEIGAMDYDRYRFMIDNLCDRQIGIIAVVSIETLLGVGDRYTNYLTTNGYANLGEFLDDPAFSSLLTSRLSELVENFPDIQYWQILNEADDKDYYKANPPEFASIIATASDTINSINPDTTIILSGLSNTWQDQGASFMQSAYGAGANDQQILSNSFDELGVHPYTDSGDPNHRGNDPNDYMRKPQPGSTIDPTGQMILDPLRQVMSLQDTNGEKTIQITEIGFDTAPDQVSAVGSRPQAGGDPCSVLRRTLVSEQEQATYLTNAFDILLNYPPAPNAVDKVIWYRYEDILQSISSENFDANCDEQESWQDHRLVSNPESPVTTVTRSRTNDLVYIKHHFGVIDENGEPKPAYCALQEVTGVGSCIDTDQVVGSELAYLPMMNYETFGLPLPRSKSTLEAEIPLSVHTINELASGQNALLFIFISIVSGMTTTALIRRQI